MSAPTNTSRGDLINVLMDVQQLCNEALAMFPPEPLGGSTAVQTLANLVLDSIHGNVTVTDQPDRTLRSP